MLTPLHQPSWASCPHDCDNKNWYSMSWLLLKLLNKCVWANTYAQQIAYKNGNRDAVEKGKGMFIAKNYLEH